MSATPQAFVVGLTAVDGMDVFTTNLPRVVLEAFFFGLYTVVCLVGYSALARGAPRTKTAWAGLAACTALYALALAHVALNLQRLAADVGSSRELALVAAICMGALGAQGIDGTCFEGEDYAGIVEPALAPAGQGAEWVPVLFLVFNILISLGVLLWRGVVPVPRWRRTVYWSTAIAYLGLVSIFIIAVVVNENLEDGFGTGALTMTWALLLVLALWKSVDMWRRRHELARGMRDMGRGASIERVAYLVLDSGVIFAAFWTVIFAWCATGWGAPNESGSAGGVRFVHAGRAFVASAFVDVVGLYTTLVLVLEQSGAEGRPRRASTRSVQLGRVRLSADSQATVNNVPAGTEVAIPKAAFAHEEWYGDAKSAGLV